MPIEPMDQPPKVDWVGRALACFIIILAVALIARGSVSVVCGR